jgi:putative DNA methylase
LLQNSAYRDELIQEVRGEVARQIETVTGPNQSAKGAGNEYLVPEGMAPGLWDRLLGPERFYLRMLDIEAGGAKKLDNY